MKMKKRKKFHATTSEKKTTLEAQCKQDMTEVLSALSSVDVKYPKWELLFVVIYPFKRTKVMRFSTNNRQRPK